MRSRWRAQRGRPAIAKSQAAAWLFYFLLREAVTFAGDAAASTFNLHGSLRLRRTALDSAHFIYQRPCVNNALVVLRVELRGMYYDSANTASSVRWWVLAGSNALHIDPYQVGFANWGRRLSQRLGRRTDCGTCAQAQG